MRAALLQQPTRVENNPLTIADVPGPVPEQNCALLKVLACGICRTDLHIVEGDLPTRTQPLILGTRSSLKWCDVPTQPSCPERELASRGSAEPMLTASFAGGDAKTFAIIPPTRGTRTPAATRSTQQLARTSSIPCRSGSTLFSSRRSSARA